MSEIKEVKLSDGSVIYVEMEKVDNFPDISKTVGNKNLPPGAREVTAVDKVVDTMQALKGTLRSVFTTIHEGLKDKSPDEWGVELNIGFKGKVTPIPVLVNSESSVAIKVHAKWIKPKTS